MYVLLSIAAAPARKFPSAWALHELQLSWWHNHLLPCEVLHRLQSNLIWCPEHLLPSSLTLSVCRTFIFHSLLSQMLSSTFYPSEFITKFLAMPSNELSFGQWQVHPGAGWENDCLTRGHPLLPSSKSHPCSPPATKPLPHKKNTLQKHKCLQC